MMDYSLLERLSYPEVRKPRRSMSPEEAGEVLALLWIEQGKPRPFPSNQSLAELVLADDVPQAVREAFAVSFKVDGALLANYSRMINSAQQSDFIGRMNPQHTAVAEKISEPAASHRLSQYAETFGTEIAWLRTRLNALHEGPE